MVLKLFFWRVPGRFGPPLYLLMGWLCLPLVWSIWSILPGHVLAFMTAGGLIYTGGVVLNKSKRPYSTAARHGCVVVASACFWFAILIGTLAGVELRKLAERKSQRHPLARFRPSQRLIKRHHSLWLALNFTGNFKFYQRCREICRICPQIAD